MNTTMSTSVKRKASSSLEPNPTETRVLNPRSHSPGILRQLAVAGLTETSHVPTERGFPHNKLHEKDPDPDLDPDHEDAHDESDTVSNLYAKHKRARKDQYRGIRASSHPVQRHGSSNRTQCIQNLAQILPRLLDNGEMDKARRVFALLARLDGSGGLLGVHKRGVWAMGLEALAHEDKNDNDNADLFPAAASSARGEGTTPTTTEKLNDFIEGLIRRYPWERKHHRGFMSSLHFWYVLFSYQIYAVYTSVVPGGAGDGADISHSEGVRGEAAVTMPEGIDGQAHDRRREAARAKLGAIADRMDRQLQDQPFAVDKALRALRGVVSSMIAGLAVGSTSRHGSTVSLMQSPPPQSPPIAADYEEDFDHDGLEDVVWPKVEW